MTYQFKKIPSPVGILKLIANDTSLVAIEWENDHPDRIKIKTETENNTHPVLLKTEKQLNEYFAGSRTEFDIPLEFTGTDFQKQVWNALLNIPFGKTTTYGEIAKKLGNPQAQQAVGAANGKNPISIIAPCHRVLGTNGSLVGFAGGLKNKAYLLDLEKQKRQPSLFF